MIGIAHVRKSQSRLALMMGFLMASTSPVLANPDGGIVAAGQASIISSGKQVDVHQSSQRAVIDWRSFNIELDEATRFIQPSSQSITVNRINDANPSRILGALSANGNIVLINPSGIMFGKDSRVDVGGLIATTLDIDNDEFMSGGPLKFSKTTGSSGPVVNEGAITAREAGLVGLVADTVENSGVISARLGKVVLASGDRVVIDFQGDGLLSLEVSDENSRRLIKHTGKIEAEGGEVLLTAATGRTIVDSLIEVKGEIKAPTIGHRNGKIVIAASGKNRTSKGGKGSKIVVDATLAARGEESGETGGDIRVLADDISIGENARILADGISGGGAINIGGSFQGGWKDADYALLSVRRPELEDLQAAELVLVDEGAEIDASSIENGNAGDIILWADKGMRYYGASRARGGSLSGNGGLIEVSGKQYLDFAGTADTRATNGKRGRLLLDPTNITISSAADQNSGSSPFYTPSGDDVTSIINVGILENAMWSNNVTIQTRATGSQAGDINIDAAITSDDYDNGYVLTLIADHDINVNAPMTYSGTGLFDFHAGHDINLNAALSSLSYMQAQNNLVVNAAQYGGYLNITVGNDIVLNADVTTVLHIDPLVSDSDFSIGSNLYTLNLDAVDLSHLTNVSLYAGLNSTLGNTDLSGNNDWGSMILYTGSGKAISVSGNHNYTGSLTLIADALSLSGFLTGAGGYFSLENKSGGASFGLGDGTGGTIHLSDADLDNMSGWGYYYFGSGSAASSMILGERDWNANLHVNALGGTITIAGDQAFYGSNRSLTLYGLSGGSVNINGRISGLSDLNMQSDNVQIGADISGSGQAQIYIYNSLGLGDGSSGTEVLSTAELNHILDGWSLVDIGSNSDVSMAAHNWNDRLEISADNIDITGAQSFGANNATLTNYTGGINIGATLSGTGNLTLVNSGNYAVGLAGAAGTYDLSTTELDNILDGWNLITIGYGNNLSTYTVNSYTWRDNVKFLNGSGNIIFNGAQNFGSNNVTISSRGLLDLNANLTGTGEVTLMNSTSGGGTAIGATAPVSYFRVSNTDINTYLIGQGWSSYAIGSLNNSGSINISGARNWDANVAIRSKGVVTISSAQSVGAHDFAIQTDSNPAINSTISGTGVLTLAPITYLDNMKTIGVGTGSGTLNVTSTELSRLSNGWSQLVFGQTDQQGEIYLGTNTFVDPVEILTGTVVYVEGNQTSTDASSNNNKMVFVAGLSFDNIFSYSVNPGAGRYLVYSQDPIMDTLGGLVRDVKKYNKTYAGYAPASVVEAGNAYFYSVAPTLNISVDDASRQYSLSNPSFTYTIDSGLIDGDLDADAISSASLSTAATAASNAGHYGITGSFLSDLGYSFAVTDGDLEVTKAQLTATANDTSRVYGAGNPSFSFSYSGFLNGDDENDIDTFATGTSPAAASSNVGTYAINGAGALDNNYDFTYVAGQVAVTPRTLHVTANPQQVFIGHQPLPYTFTYGGFVNGDTAASSLTHAVSASDNAPDYTTGGVYQITPFGAVSNGNYVFDYISGDLMVSVALPDSVSRTTSLPTHVMDLSGQNGQAPLFSNRVAQGENAPGDSVGDSISDDASRAENGDVLIYQYGTGQEENGTSSGHRHGAYLTLEKRLAELLGI